MRHCFTQKKEQTPFSPNFSRALSFLILCHPLDSRIRRAQRVPFNVTFDTGKLHSELYSGPIFCFMSIGAWWPLLLFFPMHALSRSVSFRDEGYPEAIFRARPRSISASILFSIIYRFCAAIVNISSSEDSRDPGRKCRRRHETTYELPKYLEVLQCTSKQYLFPSHVFCYCSIPLSRVSPSCSILAADRPTHRATHPASFSTQQKQRQEEYTNIIIIIIIIIIKMEPKKLATSSYSLTHHKHEGPRGTFFVMVMFMVLMFSTQNINHSKSSLLQFIYQSKIGQSSAGLLQNGNGSKSKPYDDDDHGDHDEREYEEESLDDPSQMVSYSSKSTIKIRNSPVFSDQAIVMSRPTEHNLVIAMISMGNDHSLLVHRAVRSIRASGNFRGYILVLTDKSGYSFFTQTLPGNDTKLLVMQGHDHDLNATHRPVNSTVLGRPYKPSFMIYKRFKTKLLQYVSEHPVLNPHTEYVFYMDRDNVIFHDLQELWDDYYVEFPQKYSALLEADAQRIVKNFPDSTTLKVRPQVSFASHWKEQPNGNGEWQSGQNMYHRKYSQGCLDRWRYQIESDSSYRSWLEQPLLSKATKLQYNKTFGGYMEEDADEHEPGTALCHIVELPRKKKHWSLALANVLQKQDMAQIPTILHFTKLRVRSSDPQDQINMCMKGLHLKRAKLANGTMAIVSEDDLSPYMIPSNHSPIPWEKILEPVAK
jgi:hypothetical protein